MRYMVHVILIGATAALLIGCTDVALLRSGTDTEAGAPTPTEGPATKTGGTATGTGGTATGTGGTATEGGGTATEGGGTATETATGPADDDDLAQEIAGRWQAAGSLLWAWSVPNGSQRLSRAHATADAGGLQNVAFPAQATISEPLAYRACEVFSMQIGIGDDHAPVQAAVLDCIDRDKQAGTHHVAAMCLKFGPGMFEMGLLAVIRAGITERGTTSVAGTIGGQSRQFHYRDRITFSDDETFDVHWAYLADKEMHDVILDKAGEGTGTLNFSIDADSGAAGMQAEDKDAAADYRARCVALHEASFE